MFGFRMILDNIAFAFNKLIPTQYSLIQENNILGLYDANTILTKDDNLVKAIKIDGVSYVSLNDDKIGEFCNARKNAIMAISDNVNIKFLFKRRKKAFNREEQNETITNEYAKALIGKWEGKDEIYENSYYIIIETKNKSAIGVLENLKSNLTTSINENDDSENENIDNNQDNAETPKGKGFFGFFTRSKTNNQNKIQQKERKKKANANLDFISKQNELDIIYNRIKQSLVSFFPSDVGGNEILRIYAEYCNGIYIPFNAHSGYLADNYIQSNVEFKKDYFIYNNNGSKKFSRFIAVKAYDTEYISSSFSNSLLYYEGDLNIFYYIEKLSKMKALNKITTKRRLATNLAKGELDEMKELIISDRESMQYFTFIIQIFTDTKELLDVVSKEISTTLTNQGVVNTYETINQIPIYFSFFPNKEALNNRKRLQTTEAISILAPMEKDISGYTTNTWGDYPLTIFKNQNFSPFFYNFHVSDEANVVGHTMVIGGTGAGKTTLVSFLMANCFKYDINILALDKANGLYSLTNYLNGEYLDGNNEKEPFRINPCSLEYSIENTSFIVDWLSTFLLLKKDDPNDVPAVNALKDAVNTTYETLKKQGEPLNLKTIYEAFAKIENESVKVKFREIVESDMFKSFEDSISLTNQLSVINMDFIENMKEEAGLIAYYLLYKLLYIAKNQSKGFFAFVDEFRTYAHNDIINEKINYIITQARKLNGVVALALQDLNQLEGVKNAESIIGNMGSYIIFPTSDLRQFEKYHIELSDYEKNFLSNTIATERKVLIKNRINNTSNIVNVDLGRLGDYLMFLSSSSSDVNLIKSLKQQTKQTGGDWRSLYIKERKANR